MRQLRRISAYFSKALFYSMSIQIYCAGIAVRDLDAATRGMRCCFLSLPLQKSMPQVADMFFSCSLDGFRCFACLFARWQIFPRYRLSVSDLIAEVFHLDH